MTLPPSEIERIEKKAAIFAEQSVGRTELRGNQHAFNIVNKSYQAGAQAEAVRGRELQIELLHYIVINRIVFDPFIAGWRVPLKTGEVRNLTTAELLDLYILDTQKRKG